MKRDNISKDRLIEKIYTDIGIPKNFSKKIIDFFLDTVIEGLQEDQKVKLSGFGTFKILNKRERVGRNPKTKIEYTINARKVVSFYPSKILKKKLMRNNS